MITYPKTTDARTDWSQKRNREIPGISVKLKPTQYDQLAKVAEACGQSVSKVAQGLIEIVLIYVKIEEVTEPHLKVMIDIPDKV